MLRRSVPSPSSSPTAIAAALLSQEFPSASLDTDGTLFTVIIYGVTYSDVTSRIREWMTRTRVGPVLITDGKSAEDLLELQGSRGNLRWSGAIPHTPK